MKVKALPNKILAEMIDSPDGYKKTKSGLFLSDKDGTTEAIRPRWFKLYSVGSDIDWVKPGQYVLVEHGRWTNGIKVDEELRIYMLDNKDLLLVSDEEPDLTDFSQGG